MGLCLCDLISPFEVIHKPLLATQAIEKQSKASDCHPALPDWGWGRGMRSQ